MRFSRAIFLENLCGKVTRSRYPLFLLCIALIYNGITTRAHDYGNFTEARGYIKLTHRPVMSLFDVYTREE